ncbi:MAG: hypothetical protein QGG36_25160 [Pirellulaceae bacterium]|jgi:hypothetical protein|nr:hypothetical protein [Pirellulaceae bacterium]MDP7019111.1 hypothetical protein [Pirellulaceae bacterium]
MNEIPEPPRIDTGEGEKPAVVDARHPPGFSIGHLMLLITGASAYFSIVAQLNRKMVGSTGVVILIWQSLVFGCGFLGLCVFLRRRGSNAPWRLEPGEWLAAIVGFELAVAAVLDLLNASLDSPIVRAGNVAAILGCSLLVAPTLAKSTDPKWRLVFAVMALLASAQFTIAIVWSFLSESLGDAMGAAWSIRNQAAAYGKGAAGFVGLGFAAVESARWSEDRGPRPAWLHWVGVGTWFCYAVNESFVEWLAGLLNFNAW